MIEKCYRCGSAKMRTMNLEMAFAPLKAEPVYALAKPIVCLDCGLVECSLSEEPLRKLRESALLRAADTAAGCPALQSIA
jgi:hypothetical protein